MRTCWIAVGLLACGAARAGLSLDAAIERDRRREAAQTDPGFELREPATAAGWRAFAGRRHDEAPALVGEFHGRDCGGVHWRGNEAGTGPWRWRAAVGGRCGAGRPLSLEGSSVVWRPGAVDPGSQADAAPAEASYSGHEFYASVQRRHWGPGWSGSLMLDAAAPALPAVGWRHTRVEASASPWLSWLGPWGADIFVGRLNGHREPARPALIGMRALLVPLPGLEVGLTRTLQWGGRGRDESSSSLGNALLGRDNVGFDGITAENEPGNQLAGWDFRWLVDPAHGTSLYAQVAGEDEAGHGPSRNLVLVGVDGRVPVPHGTLRVFVEWADLLAGNVSDDPRPLAAYRHALYRQGYTHEGVVLGHAAGGDVRLGTVGGLYRGGRWALLWAASIGHAEPTAQLHAPGRLYGFSATLGVSLTPQHRIGFTGARWSSRAGHRHSAQWTWQWRL